MQTVHILYACNVCIFVCILLYVWTKGRDGVGVCSLPCNREALV